MLATILNGMIVAGMVVLLHLRRSARLILSLRTDAVAREDFLRPVYDRFRGVFAAADKWTAGIRATCPRDVFATLICG
jgi:hypothetical protein